MYFYKIIHNNGYNKFKKSVPAPNLCHNICPLAQKSPIKCTGTLYYVLMLFLANSIVLPIDRLQCNPKMHSSVYMKITSRA